MEVIYSEAAKANTKKNFLKMSNPVPILSLGVASVVDKNEWRPKTLADSGTLAWRKGKEFKNDTHGEEIGMGNSQHYTAKGDFGAGGAKVLGFQKTKTLIHFMWFNYWNIYQE